MKIEKEFWTNMSKVNPVWSTESWKSIPTANKSQVGIISTRDHEGKNFQGVIEGSGRHSGI